MIYKNILRRGVCLCLALLMGAALGVNVFAAAAASELDPYKNGKISIVLEGVEEKSPADGALTLYHVADLVLDDGNMTYVYTAEFETLEIKADEISADELAAFIEENNISGVSESINEDGTVVFNGLSLGLYFIVQSSRSTGFYAIDSFIVSVPVSEGDVWIYEVDASPKTEIYTEAKAEEAVSSMATDEILPQTGQHNMAVVVLAAAGVLLLIAGKLITGKRKMKNAA